MEDRIVLTFDIGTQSSRVVLVNNYGEIVAKEQIQHEIPYESPEPGWAEKDPDFYWDIMCRGSQEIKKKSPIAFEKVEAVTVTCIRDVIVNIDKDGKPLRPSINYLDDRTAHGEPKVGGTKLIFKVIGLEEFIRLQYKKSPVNWIMENQPEIWKKTDKLMLLSGYLQYCLTGVKTDAVGSIVGHIPFDVKKRTWSDKNAITRPVFDVPNEKLPKLTESCEVMGYITDKAAELTGIKTGLPVYASGADKATETIGLGCVGKEKAAISFGTMSSITFNTPDYLEPEQFIPPFPSIIKGWYSPEYQVYRGYWLVTWFKNEFCQMESVEAAKENKSVEEVLNESLYETKPGAEGLFLSPFFTPDAAMPYARGAFIGLSDYHTKKHMYRAIIEGINFALMEGMRKMESRGKFKFKEIHVGGGGSQSPEICQITADMFGVPVKRTYTHEASALGSAAATFVALGEFKDFEEACENMVRITDVFEPDMENHKLYEKLFEIYKKIYPTLKPLYASIAEIYPR